MQLIGGRKHLQPQQLLQADVLNMQRKFTGIMQPRRATKTAGILAWLIGRCLMESDLSVAYTICTLGKATRSKFIKEVVPPLERVWPYEDDRPFRILRGQGSEMLKFDNGSFLSFVTFNAEAFRSDAFDIIVLDEAQDPEPDDAAEVLAAIMPTLDTRPSAQLVIAGTAGKFREGNMLWNELEKGEAGEDRHAILVYRAPVDHDEVDVDVLVSDWATVERLIHTCHPGVKTKLTGLDAVEDNWRTLKRPLFAQEYLGIFGKSASTSFLNVDDWNANRQEGKMPTPPTHFRFALAVHPDSTAWSIVAAWRDNQNRPCLAVLGTGPQTYGAYAEARRLSLKYKVPIVYDAGQSANTAVMGENDRRRPKAKTQSLQWGDVSSGVAQLVAEIRTRRVVHWGHEGMDKAIVDAVKRGTRDAKRWGLGRANPDDPDQDITTLEAAANALRAYDSVVEQKPEIRGILV